MKETTKDSLAPVPTPSPFRCLHELLAFQSERAPEAVAICAPGRMPLTYGGLLRQVEDTVRALNDLGVGRNDRVAMVLPNGPEMAAAFLGVAAGATAAPLNPAYGEGEFDFYLGDLEAKALVVQAGDESPSRAAARRRGIPLIELSPILDGEAGSFELSASEAHQVVLSRDSSTGPAQPEEVALVLHTSGTTTSRPKMVPLTQTNLCASARNIGATLRLSPRDRCLNVMPLFHIHGLVAALLASLAAGASVICTPGFFAPRFFGWMREFSPTWYTAVPTMHQAILARAEAHRVAFEACPLRLIRSSSAALPSTVLAQLEEVFGVPVIEAYGMTESAHQMASNPLPPRARKPGSVGLAAGPEIAIMDEAGRVRAAGQVGEIVIRGDNVTPGYEGNPQANASAFAPDGWLRTGDQGYLDHEGYLFITARIKELINRGGEKVSPREVDEALLDHPAVAQAVAFAMPHAQLGEEVAAAVVLKPNTTARERELREFAAARLADYKVPRRIVLLGDIPKGPSGKVQRIGLAGELGLTAGVQAQPQSETDSVHPRTPLEEGLVAIWAQVLGVERVGIHDDFFYLGGDSMLATQILSRARKVFGVELSLLSLFETPTVAGLAATITRRLAQEVDPQEITQIWAELGVLSQEGVGGAATERTIPRRSSSERCSLSFAQERLWFLDQLEPGGVAYNRPAALRLTGSLDAEALKRSLNEIVRRHEALRTTFALVDGTPVQVISPSVEVGLPIEDLSGLPEAQRETEARRLSRQEARSPFDLERGPLFRAKLIRLGQEVHLLLVSMHHIVSDGWSDGVLFRELAALYEAFSEGKPSPLPEPPIQYADYALWQRQWLRGEALEEQLGYWKEQLAELPVLELPTDHPRPAVQTHRGARQSLTLPRSLSEGLRKLAHREGATLFMLLLGAFQVLLSRYSGQEDVAVGAPIAGRNRAETEGLIGFFVNTVVMRTDLSGDPTCREVLSRVREVALGAYDHQDVPFEKLVEELRPERDPSRSPLFQVAFQLRNMPNEPVELPDLKIEDFEFDSGIARVDLTSEVVEGVKGLKCTFEYNTDLFEAATIERMGEHFQTLLEGIVTNPERRISELLLLTEAERRQLLFEWNDTHTEYPQDRCVHELFEERAERTPEAVAVVFEDEQLTYRELNRRANQLAHHLRKLGVGPEVLVGICVERSVEMVVGLLGILKTGGAYVPLDPAYPKERLAFMIEDTQVPVLLTQQRLAERLPKRGAQVVRLDADWPLIAQEEAEENLASEATADNLAYVIYTSGSTGKPKGVMVEHRTLCSFILADATFRGVTASDRVLQFASLSFDSSVMEIFPYLACGGTVVLRGERMIESMRRFVHETQQQAISVLILPTAFWHELVAAFEREELTLPPSVRLVSIGGEKALAGRVTQWHAHVSQTAHPVRLINAYGPTEATVYVTQWELRPEAAPDTLPRGKVPIGRPLGRARIYILDKYLNPVPIGVPGELYIGGPVLARGYLNRPELTAEKFVPDPFSDEPGARLYRTGDLVRYLPDGNIEYLGRLDHQVKIRGFRVEPGEIEVMVDQHSEVRENVVVAQEDTAGDKRLVAYVVPHQWPAPPVGELRGFLKKRLPEYMVPSAFMMLEELPLTPNGKVDRKALPAPDLAMQVEAITLPRTPTEEPLAEIWSEVLGLEQIGIHDDFFELGGHSLLATQLVSRVRDAFGVELPLRCLFDAPTLAELAERIEVARWSDPTSSTIMPSTDDFDEGRL